MSKETEAIAATENPFFVDSPWEGIVSQNLKAIDDRRAMEEKERLERYYRKKQEEKFHKRMNITALGLALVTAGGIYMNYVDGFPLEISVSVAVAGVALLAFVLGLLVGEKRAKAR